MEKKTNQELAHIVNEECEFSKGRWIMPVPMSYEVRAFQEAYVVLRERGYSDLDIYERELGQETSRKKSG